MGAPQAFERFRPKPQHLCRGWQFEEHLVQSSDDRGQHTKCVALALAFLRAIFNVDPIALPLFAPLKGQATALTNLGFKPVFRFRFAWHALNLLRPNQCLDV